MPSIIVGDQASGPRISIRGDSLTIAPTLKPKPSAGVQVMFMFQFFRSRTEHLCGAAGLCDVYDVKPRPADFEQFKNLKNLNHLLQMSRELVGMDYFRELDAQDRFDLSLATLASALLKDLSSLRQLFLAQTLRTFLKLHTVTATIDDEGGTLKVGVDFHRNGIQMFHFGFKVKNKEDAEQLFEFRENSAL